MEEEQPAAQLTVQVGQLTKCLGHGHVQPAAVVAGAAACRGVRGAAGERERGLGVVVLLATGEEVVHRWLLGAHEIQLGSGKDRKEDGRVETIAHALVPPT